MSAIKVASLYVASRCPVSRIATTRCPNSSGSADISPTTQDYDDARAPLLAQLDAHGIRLVPVRHEAAGVYMAEDLSCTGVFRCW
jgi:hypothetical protein